MIRTNKGVNDNLIKLRSGTSCHATSPPLQSLLLHRIISQGFQLLKVGLVHASRDLRLTAAPPVHSSRRSTSTRTQWVQVHLLSTPPLSLHNAAAVHASFRSSSVWYSTYSALIASATSFSVLLYAMSSS